MTRSSPLVHWPLILRLAGTDLDTSAAPGKNSRDGPSAERPRRRGGASGTAGRLDDVKEGLSRPLIVATAAGPAAAPGGAAEGDRDLFVAAHSGSGSSRGVSHACDTPLEEPDPLCAATNKSRSEEHTSELQSRRDIVCRLLL